MSETHTLDGMALGGNQVMRMEPPAGIRALLSRGL